MRDAGSSVMLSERRLESMIEDERRKIEAQRARVATISHEFRTPLTIIDGHCHYLLTSDCQPADTVVPRLEAIRDSVKRILDLVEGILLSEPVEQDMLDFESRSLDAGVLVADICRRHRAASLNDRIDFSGPIVRLPVKGDDRLLQYAVDNLLSNALKYPSGRRPTPSKMSGMRSPCSPGGHPRSCVRRDWWPAC